MEDNPVFMSMSVRTPLIGWSGVLFLVVGYCAPLTLVTTGTSLQDLVVQDTMQRYVIRSVLVVYLPLLLLSTLTYHSKTSTTNTRLVYIIRTARTSVSALETLALALYAVITPHENKRLNKSGVYYLISLHSINTVLTTLLVHYSLPKTPYKTISVSLKLCLIFLSLLLRHVSLPVLCGVSSSVTCIVHQAFFLPLFALFHGSAVLDIGDKKVVIRYSSVKAFEGNRLLAKHDRIQRTRVPDVETFDF